jgi:hypothetical protein
MKQESRVLASTLRAMGSSSSSRTLRKRRFRRRRVPRGQEGACATTSPPARPRSRRNGAEPSRPRSGALTITEGSAADAQYEQQAESDNQYSPIDAKEMNGARSLRECFGGSCTAAASHRPHGATQGRRKWRNAWRYSRKLHYPHTFESPDVSFLRERERGRAERSATRADADSEVR